VLLICPLSHRSAISHYIRSEPSISSLRIDIQPYDQSADLGVGTCTLLRHFSNKIQEDFVLLPVDFIPPHSFSLANMLTKFRTDTASDGAIATACWFELRRLEKGAVVDEWGPLPPPVPIVWEEKSMTLLHVDTPDDVDCDAEAVNLRMGMLNKWVDPPKFSPA
jgi:translation initiation factor eIF-2B subunit gamma